MCHASLDRNTMFETNYFPVHKRDPIIQIFESCSIPV
jgi:hypothetical protein